MSQTVIGPQTRIAGALSGADDLIVEGIVEGPINGDGAVVIKTGARVGGPVRGRDVTIAGELAHPVYATHIVRLTATAKLTGDIEAPRIAIDEGATFEGQVRMRKPSLVTPSATVTPAIAQTASVPAKPTAAMTTPAIATVTTPAKTPTPTPTVVTPAMTQTAPEPVKPTAEPVKHVQTQPAPQLRAIPELATPGRKRLIRKAP